ncbi:hypothetical protein [Novosphingobium sp. PP1Y]|uniref:hypothetical protein n=1 Tax=Novosphingobium sp. PP1Y TaxID=702113 RepID=UPI00020EFB45|nr:hypothetical protein [Novosphingobium sp. PP1Y]CCA90035.1 hypothetical protein PP1Y_Mpl334 [Novosphingobium sp. PP1Y]
MSLLAKAVGFRLLIERLDQGKWGDTTLPRARGLAAEITASSTVDLGKLTLFESSKIASPANRWDVSNWNTYPE